MSRFIAATEAWLRSISSATMAGPVSIGAGAPPSRPARRGPRPESDGIEVAAFEDGLERVPDQRGERGSDLPRTSSGPGGRLDGDARPPG